MEVATNYNQEQLKTNSVRGMLGVIQFKISHIPDLYINTLRLKYTEVLQAKIGRVRQQDDKEENNRS
jgi:hypothetical protein